MGGDDIVEGGKVIAVQMGDQHALQQHGQRTCRSHTHHATTPSVYEHLLQAALTGLEKGRGAGPVGVGDR